MKSNCRILMSSHSMFTGWCKSDCSLKTLYQEHRASQIWVIKQHHSCCMTSKWEGVDLNLPPTTSWCFVKSILKNPGWITTARNLGWWHLHHQDASGGRRAHLRGPILYLWKSSKLTNRHGKLSFFPVNMLKVVDFPMSICKVYRGVLFCSQGKSYWNRWQTPIDTWNMCGLSSAGIGRDMKTGVTTGVNMLNLWVELKRCKDLF